MRPSVRVVVIASLRVLIGRHRIHSMGNRNAQPRNVVSEPLVYQIADDTRTRRGLGGSKGRTYLGVLVVDKEAGEIDVP